MLMGAKRILKKYKTFIFLSNYPNHIQKLSYQKSFFFGVLENLDYKIFDLNGKKPSVLKNTEYLLIHKKGNLDYVFKDK